jgi:hypothetical protein
MNAHPELGELLDLGRDCRWQVNTHVSIIHPAEVFARR